MHTNLPKNADKKKTTIESFIRFAEGRELPAHPLELFLEVSNVCNLRCAMCPTFSALNPNRANSLKNAQRGFLDTDVLGANLESVLEHALVVHCFGYGEPTVHPSFREFIDYVAGFEVMIDFFTNGMLLTPDLCRFLVEKRIAAITVSFSGSTKEDYESVYLGGKFETVLLGLRNLAEEKCRAGSRFPIVSVNSIAFEHHINTLDTFVDLMADHGVQTIQIKNLVTYGLIPELAGHEAVPRLRGIDNVVERALERAAKRGILLSAAEFLTDDHPPLEAGSRAGEGTKELVSIRSFPERARKLLSRTIAEQPPSTEPTEKIDGTVTDFSEEELQSVFEIQPLSGQPFYCFEPFNTLYIRRNGLVKPCCFSPDESLELGDLKRSTGEDVWNGSRLSTIRKSILGHRYPMTSCGHCVKNRLAPPTHSGAGRISEYVEWFQESFGSALMPNPVHYLLELGGNTTIIERLRGNRPDLFAGTTKLKYPPEEPPPVVVKPFEGYVDVIISGVLHGWAWMPSSPLENLLVEILDDGVVIGRAIANLFRDDLVAGGKGCGRYGFEFRIPMELFNGQTHSFQARPLGSDTLLSGGPVVQQLEQKNAAPQVSEIAP